IALSKRANVMCKWTSFVSVAERDNAVVGQLVTVPVQMNSRNSELGVGRSIARGRGMMSMSTYSDIFVVSCDRVLFSCVISMSAGASAARPLKKSKPKGYDSESITATEGDHAPMPLMQAPGFQFAAAPMATKSEECGFDRFSSYSA